MKKLSQLYNVDSDVVIKDIKINSKLIEPGDIFVCTMGVTVDRHDYIDEAIKRGASAIVVSKEVSEKSVPIIKVENTNLELPLLSAKLFDYPEKELTILGITGTNGKTTTAKIIQNLIGDECAYIGTLGAHYLDKKEKLVNTTPDSNILFRLLRDFVDAGCKYVVMETSSEAFFRSRLDYFTFDVGILTNVTGDHLNIHKTMENYISCKEELFKSVREDGYIILNKDDQYYERFSKLHPKKYSYSIKEDADLKITNYLLNESNTSGEIVFEDKHYPFSYKLFGEYNLSNLAAATLALITLNFTPDEIINRLKNIQEISGRGETINFNQDYKIILDYAHTPDALEKILNYLNHIRKGKIYTVFGSAGGREVEKRGPMGKVVLDRSDLAILTMDDPRNEDVKVINQDLLSLTNKDNYIEILNREEAIDYALTLAKKDDIVLIAGKGDDPYMAILDKYEPYSDYDSIKKHFSK